MTFHLHFTENQSRDPGHARHRSTRNSCIHCRQLVKLVRYFLRSPGNWPTKDREIVAAKKVAEEEDVTRETIQDGGTRRLGLNIEGFRKRLEAIEAEYRQVHGAEE